MKDYPDPEEEAFVELSLAYKKLLDLDKIKSSIEADHLGNTPSRVVKALTELIAGYDQKPEDVLRTSFCSSKYNQMISVNDIGYTSLCAHHMLPFGGKVHFAYIPRKQIVGLSKIPRLVDVYARRLQVQERLAIEIVDAFQR